MKELDKLQAYMADYLEGQGIPVVLAWPETMRKRLDRPVVVVSLRSCEGGPTGFQDYLGERFDEKTGIWQELYGKRVKVVFGLDIYAPRESGVEGCQTIFNTLAGALNSAGPTGLHISVLSSKETLFQTTSGLYYCPAEGVCEVWVYAVADEEGIFSDFEVKGARRWN